MAKATIAMVEKSAGFGSASTLSSQPLNVPRSNYFGERDAIVTTQQQKPTNQVPMPQFDMDLKALFSEDEIASRPLAEQFRLHTAGKKSQQARQGANIPRARQSQQPATTSGFPTAENFLPQQSPTMLSTTTSSSTHQPTQQFNPQYHSASPPLSLSNQTPFQPLAQTISHSQPDFSLDADMSFLDTFPISDPSGQSGWGGGWNDFDMGFATGGTGAMGWDSGGEWSGVGGGVDMFDGFFFGGEGGFG